MNRIIRYKNQRKFISSVSEKGKKTYTNDKRKALVYTDDAAQEFLKKDKSKTKPFVLLNTYRRADVL